MELTQEVIQIIINIASGLITLASVAITFFIKKKVNDANNEINKLEGAIVSDNESIGKLEENAKIGEKLSYIFNNVIPSAIDKAENAGLGNGAIKKLYAMSIISLECIKCGIDYNANADKFSEKLEELVKLTNRVNTYKQIED